MATIYIFANNTYATLEEARAAAATKIAELDSNPTGYARVKLLSGSEADGWEIPVEDLSDAEIIALAPDDGNYYGVYSVYEGDMQVGITSAAAIEEIERIKNNVNNLKIISREEIDP